MSFSDNLYPARVLCITLRAGSVGHAVLDGFGILDGAFFTSRFDHLAPRRRFNWLLQLVRTSFARFHPTRVVLGLPESRHSEKRSLAKRLAQRLASLGVRVSIRRLRDAALILVAERRLGTAKELAAKLAEHFVPELALMRDRSTRRAWYWRPAWFALAIALAVLVERHPRVAAALAQPSAFLLEPFRRALVASEQRLNPHAV